MATRLKTYNPHELKAVNTSLATLDKPYRPSGNAAQRLAGRTLQTLRTVMWRRAEGRCASCGRLTDFPDGFELDHKIRIEDGGTHAHTNLQVLCCDPITKRGCHADKTRQENMRGSYSGGSSDSRTINNGDNNSNSAVSALRPGQLLASLQNYKPKHKWKR